MVGPGMSPGVVTGLAMVRYKAVAGGAVAREGAGGVVARYMDVAGVVMARDMAGARLGMARDRAMAGRFVARSTVWLWRGWIWAGIGRVSFGSTVNPELASPGRL